MKAPTKSLIAMVAMAASLTAVSIPAMATAAPAQVQTRIMVVAHNDHRGPDNRWSQDNRASAALDSRIARLSDRLEQGRRTGQLRASDSRRLSGELRAIITQKRSFERSGRGLNRAEINRLDNRLDKLQSQIRFQTPHRR